MTTSPSQSLNKKIPPTPDYLKFEQALGLFDVLNTITIDTETNGQDLRDGRGHLYGLSVAGNIPGIGRKSTYIPIAHPADLEGYTGNIDRVDFERLKTAIENYKGWIVFHNAKFDLESLLSIGINYKGNFICTMIATHMINENLPYSRGLEACVNYFLKKPGKKESPMFKGFLGLYGWAGMLSYIIFEYGAGDAEITDELWEHLKPKFEEEIPAAVWEHKQKFHNVIRTMERRGVRVDTELCKRMTVHGENAMEDIVELLGGRNPGSPKVLKELLIDELKLPVVKRSKKTGAPSFDKEAMEIYEQILERRGSENPIAEYILAYRGWQKSVSSNYKPYVSLLSPDGRLRCNYRLDGTKTGRMSCANPNLQQIPRSGEKPWNGIMKKAFIPRDGYTLWEADYSQLELRLATAYADEQGLKQVFAEGRDVFTEMSVDLQMARHDVKTLTYTIQYGGGVTRISHVFGVPPERAAEIRENFYQQYPGFRAKSDVAAFKARRNRKVRLWSGRSRHFLYPADEAHKAFNSIIQGGAADIVERTMVRLYEEVDHDEKCRMLLQVHDSIVFEIKNGEEEHYLPLIKQTMENIPEPFGVKFAVDIHKWGE